MGWSEGSEMTPATASGEAPSRAGSSSSARWAMAIIILVQDFPNATCHYAMHDQSVESEANLIHYVTDIAVMDHGVANDVASWVTE